MVIFYSYVGLPEGNSKRYVLKVILDTCQHKEWTCWNLDSALNTPIANCHARHDDTAIKPLKSLGFLGSKWCRGPSKGTRDGQQLQGGWQLLSLGFTVVISVFFRGDMNQLLSTWSTVPLMGGYPNLLRVHIHSTIVILRVHIHSTIVILRVHIHSTIVILRVHIHLFKSTYPTIIVDLPTRFGFPQPLIFLAQFHCHRGH